MPTFSKRIKSSDLDNLRRRAASHGTPEGVYISGACGDFTALTVHQQAPDLLNTSLVSIRHSTNPRFIHSFYDPHLPDLLHPLFGRSRQPGQGWTGGALRQVQPYLDAASAGGYAEICGPGFHPSTGGGQAGPAGVRPAGRPE